MNRKANESSVVFPTTEKTKQRVAIIKETGNILKKVYKNLWAVHEVNAAIKSEFYVDERVLLRDLLTPETSPLYSSAKFLNANARKGTFKKMFAEELSKGYYPLLKSIMGTPPSVPSRQTAEVWPSVDSTNEIWTSQWGIRIYFPYSENFPWVSPNDPGNNTPDGNLVTIVSADREADSGPGDEPYFCFSYPNNNLTEEIKSVCYRPVTVNDDYAEAKPTHIVGVGAEPVRIMTDPPPPAGNVHRVFHGWSALTQQLDRFISFTGNGGGSEIKVARINGYLQFQNQQVTNFTGDVNTVNYTRKEITKKRWKRVYTVWNPDWNVNNLEQTYAVWEEDNEGTKTFTGSLGTTVRIDSNTTATGNIGFSITTKTQDELVTQRKITRAAYFGAAKSDQACGFQMCDDKGCRYDDTFLTSGQYWPIYDCGSIWRYTWPYNFY